MSFNVLSPVLIKWKNRFIQRATAGGVAYNLAEDTFNCEYRYKGSFIDEDDPEQCADNLIHDLDSGLLI